MVPSCCGCFPVTISSGTQISRSCFRRSPRNCAETLENHPMKATPSTSPVPLWRAPPETLVLGPDEVHVWRATLDQTRSQIQNFRHSLAADEQARAERFYFERDRGHFIIARGVLRAILGGYLKRAPEGL